MKQDLFSNLKLRRNGSNISMCALEAELSSRTKEAPTIKPHSELVTNADEKTIFQKLRKCGQNLHTSSGDVGTLHTVPVGLI